MALGAGNQTWQISDDADELFFSSGTTPVERMKINTYGTVTATNFKAVSGVSSRGL